MEYTGLKSEMPNVLRQGHYRKMDSPCTSIYSTMGAICKEKFLPSASTTKFTIGSVIMFKDIFMLQGRGRFGRSYLETGKSSPYMHVRRTFFNNFNYSILFIRTLQEKFFLLHFLANVLFPDSHFPDYMQQSAVFQIDFS